MLQKQWELVGLLITEFHHSNISKLSGQQLVLQIQKIPTSLTSIVSPGAGRKVDHGRNDPARPADLRNVTLAATKLGNLGKGFEGFESWKRTLNGRPHQLQRNPGLPNT